jgi:hypothetical protein
MEEGPENDKEPSHSAHDNGIEWNRTAAEENRTRTDKKSTEQNRIE